ncbi:DASH family cryptochrome [Lewinellaceae bacterium SD302]|nr:DASH family cryptochrome [Lewinellaceae bacterium SD302]
MSLAIYWHRDDLRLHDNPCLHRAVNGYDRVLPIFIFDPRQFEMLPLGFRKTGYHRFIFLKDCIAALQQSYQEKGGNLLVVLGRPEEILADLLREQQADIVLAQAEVASEETTVERSIAAALQTEFELIWGKSLYHRDDLPFGFDEIPATSKSFRIRAQKEAGVRELLPTPDRIDCPELTDWGKLPVADELGFRREEALDFQAPVPAGEKAALERLHYYTFETRLVEKYKWTRNKSLGIDYSSKFSAWLNRGCLSPRQVYHTVKRYEKEVKRNISTWWLIFEVVWRDFFIFSHAKYGDKIFRAGGIKNRETDWKHDKELFDRWCRGETGIPFADAHLRELWETGFMSNRGRVNTASFLTRDYEIDWRWGAAWFESQLLDYEVSANWFNWNTQATEIYYTNPVHQSMKYDKNGEYILSQLPELAALPFPFFHAPWLTQEFTGVEPVKSYPQPAFIQKKWGRSIGNIRKEIPEEYEDLVAKKG